MVQFSLMLENQSSPSVDAPKTKKPQGRFVQTLSRCWNYLCHGRYRFAILFPAMLLGLYILYFAFVFKSAPTYADVGTTYWHDVRLICLRALMTLIDLGLLVYGFIAFYHRRLNFHQTALILTGLAMSVIITYSFTTPTYDYNMVWNQHDISYAWPDSYDYGGGHFGIIMNFFKTWGVTGLKPNGDGTYNMESFSAVLERYQPKLFYILSGLFMKFNALFIHCGDGVVGVVYSSSGSLDYSYGLTNTDWACFESLRILYCYMELVQLYFFYKLFQELKFKGLPLLLGYGITIFTPIWCYFANWVNNDGMACFFSVLALYFCLRYFREKDFVNCYLMAFAIGFAMSCKLGGALIALVIAPFLLYVFIASFKNGTWKRTLLQAGLFALIVFPVGLYWPIYQKIKYGQPLLFFMPVSNPALHISNENFFDRFVWWPNSDVFNIIFVVHSNTDANYHQDTSLITALLKTSLYGEYGFGKSAVLLACLYIAGCLLFLTFLLAVVYLLVQAIRTKKVRNPLRLLTFSGLFIFMYGWAVWFVSAHSDTCNEDIRYTPLLVLLVAGVLGSATESLLNFSGPHQKVFRRIGAGLLSLAAFYAFSVAVSYLSLSAWYA